MTALELWSGTGDTLADALVRSAQARTLADLVSDAKKHADMALEDKVAEVQQATGTAFTARGDGELHGWSALVTAPQPKPHVTDRDRFAAWWHDQDLPCDTLRRVRVVDEFDLAGWLDALGNGDVDYDGKVASKIVDCLESYDEVLLPENVLDRLAEEPRFAVTDDAVVDTVTGEQVPGVTVARQAPRLQVRGTADAKRKARRDLSERLGIPAELSEGALR